MFYWIHPEQHLPANVLHRGSLCSCLSWGWRSHISKTKQNKNPGDHFTYWICPPGSLKSAPCWSKMPWQPFRSDSGPAGPRCQSSNRSHGNTERRGDGLEMGPASPSAWRCSRVCEETLREAELQTDGVTPRSHRPLWSSTNTPSRNPTCSLVWKM